MFPTLGRFESAVPQRKFARKFVGCERQNGDSQTRRQAIRRQMMFESARAAPRLTSSDWSLRELLELVCGSTANDKRLPVTALMSFKQSMLRLSGSDLILSAMSLFKTEYCTLQCSTRALLTDHREVLAGGREGVVVNA